MVIIAVVALLAGIVCGIWIFPPEVSQMITGASELILVLLMFSVGISVGLNKLAFRKIKEYHVKIFIIPFGIVLGSLVGGICAGLLLDMPLRQSVPISSAMGWYSLSGVLMTDLEGADVGAVSFLANLLREILSFLLIPLIAKRFNYYTAIAPAGATSEDTTLPMFIRYTSEEIVIMAVLNGVICSTLVPILISLFHRLFSGTF